MDAKPNDAKSTTIIRICGSVVSLRVRGQNVTAMSANNASA
jgi:hypothetical protein